MSGYVHDEVDADEIARQERLYRPLAQAVRELADAVIRTTAPEAAIAEAQAAVEEANRVLRKSALESSYGVRFNDSGQARAWGNAVVGLRNPVAPPLVVKRDPIGKAWSDFHLGAAYEGPPGLVHGGVSALILDQLLGEAAGAGGKPGMTGTLTLRYRRGTPLGDLHAEASIDRVEGIKTFVVGHISDADGITVEAEGVFILPRWAREESQQERFE